MKKIYVLVALCLIILISMGFYINKTSQSQKYGKTYSDLYETFDKELAKIEKNMNEIAVKEDDEWKSIKVKETDDKKLFETYNMLVIDINNCYKDFKTSNSNSIFSYRDKVFIFQYKLDKIQKKESCLNNFEKYSSLVLSDDTVLSNKLKKQIAIITENIKNQLSDDFEEVLFNEIVTVSKISSLSLWLKVEYLSQLEN